jgi:hypothetical protein
LDEKKLIGGQMKPLSGNDIDETKRRVNNFMKESDRRESGGRGESLPKEAQSKDSLIKWNAELPVKLEENTRYNQEIDNDKTIVPKKIKYRHVYENCVTKFSFATKKGHSPSNPMKMNQDSYITTPHISELRFAHFFAVADGHGTNGQHVSQFLKSVLPQATGEVLKPFIIDGLTNSKELNFKDVEKNIMETYL